ncbi:hypothetical protein QQS21_009272 [Conoideocrella luteorostrata]|uniref:Uncharacterized protein n=1 Tax=Conoideocrella luteorostrata TaxID=1105319 RepID=A0AAJ0CH79_9HYPO|nr:hypothetical protein QQS21_009272 [Conoideocrella luteorostrata]
MGDALNIQNSLDTGYFPTSRARSTAPLSSPPRPPPMSRSAPPDAVPPPVPVHGQIPRTVYLAPAPPPKGCCPRPAIVEDEAESLAKEYGSSTPGAVSDEEPLSKGDVDQYPVIMEVHEHNPERRFVIVPEPEKDQVAFTEQKPKAERRPEGDEQRDPVSSRKTLRPQDGQHKDGVDTSRHGLGRRKSRQDLPSIDTEADRRRDPSHHRTQSAATGARSDYFDPRPSRPQGDYLLSPDAISNEPKGREKSYRGMGQSSGAYSARSPSRTSHQFDTYDRGPDRDYNERDRTTSSARRSNTTVDSSKPRRRMTNDVDHRYKDEFMYSKGDKQDSSQAYGRSDASGPKLSPRPSRDPSRSGDDYSKSPRSSGYFSSKPVVVQDEKPSGRQSRRDDTSRHNRSSSRARTLPIAAAAGAAAGSAAASQVAYEASRASLRASAKPATRTTEQTRASKPQLPYPDDDLPLVAGLGIQSTEQEARHPKLANMTGLSMPEPFPTAAGASGRPFDPRDNTSTTPATMNTPQPWAPTPFDPEKDGLPTERPIGAYRRFSENNSKDGAGILPECPRQNPVTGLVDWLTLPHSSFNICPSCYNEVFANSEYRTLFKPLLRPSDEPISCDFGVSPWYRIAWLLTVKDEVADLRLLQQIAKLSSASNRESCAGSRKVTRNWLTIKDPHTRLPVTDFAVCYQCARTVELLLPNLTGVFEPLDSRPKQDVCALHFTPERKEFVLFFDALETTSDKAMKAKKPPNVDDLARQLWQQTVGAKCREDTPVIDGYWHTMQFLPDFTVCGNCFDAVVKPKVRDENFIARNFYMKPQRLPSATCQLYSARMREIFRRSCRGNDHKYLQEKVIQRRDKEKDIYDQLVKLDRANASSSWKEEQVRMLVEEWNRWE